MNMERHNTETEKAQEKKQERMVGVGKVLRAAAMAGLIGVLEACGGGVSPEASKHVPRVELEAILESSDAMMGKIIRTEGRLRNIGDRTIVRHVFRPKIGMDAHITMENATEETTLQFYRLATPFEHSMLAARMPDAPLFTEQSVYEVAGVIERHEVKGEQGAQRIFFITGAKGEAESSAPVNTGALNQQ